MVNEGHSSARRRGEASRRACVWVNTDLARICLLWMLIALYMLFGAAVFSELERSGELRARSRWDGQVSEFAQVHQVSPGDLRTLLKQYEEANAGGVRADPRRPRWDFSGSFYFVATVVSTIGYGMTAPCTMSGKIFLIPYGLFGCAATILFFNLFLERAITLISFVMYSWHKRRRIKGSLRRSGEREREEEEEEEEWRPSVYYVTLILGALALLVACSASGLYSAVEGWDYFESMYFCFVTFSTMGFGDLVSGQREWYHARWFYQVGNSLVIMLGACCTYSLFNIMSVIIKQALNWMLAKLLCLWRGCGACGEGGEDEEGAPGVRLTATRHGRHWSFSVVRFAPAATPRGKCLCAGSGVDTVCKTEERRGAERDTEGHRCRRPGEEVVSGAGPGNLRAPGGHRCTHTFARQSSLPEGVGAIAMLNNRLQETRINM
ncbi:potassium channel subfamily K member 13 [Clupea harengus]|uniref:Potassium channel subfamily K member 13 n=1 Tax=Clupea harengus TaxID=7950 RepID=A0A6P8FQX2_CLUHA|nr:potassium channel subfamily K member 13 [Clupea harengus]